MDVICDRCKAEYEFDEALLGDKGTTVKCSACGHVFRVSPPSRDANRSQLKLRLHKDGSVKSLGSLRELQQRIRAGEVSLDDELGRDGFPFRLLRDVPELKNFFISAPPPSMSAPVERGTMRPEASRAAPLPDAPTRVHDRPPAARAPFATVARDAGATAVPTGDTLLGSAPTAHANPRSRAEEPRASRGAPGDTRAVEPRPASLGSHAEEPRASAHHPAAAAPPTAGAPIASPESRSRSFSKHTMMGVGPEDLQLPPPPRVPQFGAGAGAGHARPAALPGERGIVGGGAAGARPVAPSLPLRADEPRASAAGAHAASKPGAPNPVRERTQPAAQDKTLHGIPVVAPAPAPPGYAGQPLAAANPSGGLPPLKPSVRPASASLDRGGTMTPISAAAAAGPSSPSAAEPPQKFSDVRSRAEEPRAAPPSAGGSSEDSPAAHEDRPEPAARRGVAPFDMASSAFPQLEGEVQHLPDISAPRPGGPSASARGASARAQAGPAPKLYLEDEDRPPERASASSSKLWLYVGLLLLIGGGAYLGVTRFQVLGQPTGEPAPLANPEPGAVQDASLAANAQAAGEPGAHNEQPGAPNAPEPAAPAPALAPPVPGVDPSAGATQPDFRSRAEEPRASTPAAAAPKASVPAAAEPQRDQPGRDKSAAAASAASTPASGKAERAPRATADPQDYGGWVSRGDQLFSKGDHEGASKAYKAAIALRPSGSEANSGLGFSLLNEGHARESLPYFDRASSSGYAEANIGLGDAYRKLGQPSSAKEAYQAYLDRLPSGARANYARSALDKLKGGSGSSDKPADNKPAAAPGAAGDYRPAGELLEPSAPPPSAPPPPTAPAASPPTSPPPTAPSETPP